MLPPAQRLRLHSLCERWLTSSETRSSQVKPQHTWHVFCRLRTIFCSSTAVKQQHILCGAAANVHNALPRYELCFAALLKPCAIHKGPYGAQVSAHLA